ncbi:ABC transporter permease [Chromohalobacter canadensis]|uniref:ABC transporter permease n=1 Tax=Chromohalobacter canadensis TaxID=141389 RepID=A0ABZ0Y9I3_9GAMM|nr:ABC transporter permease [Chromohalobacter canadensis]MCK0767929.1 ABC transporter permease [Chromohalobacter canadensis]MCT8467647.1 ABC transporter permease [Chromohalobacter canadensis]MCT8470605.1 ABC transporter permease [Chromohalobacter canadensis]MCT8498144.1 ABC transporter permease [Chromohalobacter canadensis]WQH08498.1 ABC transporter permease [Chromohalobacter canadensis]
MSFPGAVPTARSRAMVRETRHLLFTVTPGAFWIFTFLVLPSAYLMGVAFMTNGPYGLPQMPLSLDSFERLAGVGFLGWSPGNLYTLLRSLWQTLVSTVLVVIIAYPVAYYITTCREKWRPILLLLVVVPSWTNQVIRAFGWMNLLAPGTPLSNLAESLGLVAPNMGLYPSNFAVTLGLVYNFLPFMVLPLYAAFEKLDTAQVQAAQDLYASPVRAFWHAVFPQTLPGLLAGTVLVAIPAFGMYVIPELLGGGKGMMLGNLVANQFSGSSNWPLGAAGAILMLIATFIGLFAMRRIGKRLGGGEEVVI